MKIRGIIPAMVTPLNENGINEEGTRKLVRHLIAGGVHGLFILGTNGEFHTLSKEEKIQFAKIVVDEVSGRVPEISSIVMFSRNYSKLTRLLG